MQQDDWARLKELFEDAVAQTAPERSAFVEAACSRHPHLAATLRELLASNYAAGEFLETPVLIDLSEVTVDDIRAETLHPGDVIGDTYEVQSELGEGGMGVVYRVRHRGLQRSFAAKVIHANVAADHGFVARFEREAVALGRLKHQNIVDVTDYGVERSGARPYLVMECLEGTTLGERLRTGPLPVGAALSVFGSLAAALDHAHAQGVLHLDLKPANVFLNDSSDTPEVKILDFGLAQFTTSDAEPNIRTVPLAGTPAYLAPELLQGKVPGPAADIYALGVLMYETLTGRTPFEGTVREVLQQQRHSMPALPSAVNPQVPSDLDDALIEILSKDPAARPSSAVAAVSLLRDALTRHRQRAWRRHEIPRRMLVAAALGLFCAAISPLLTAWRPLQRFEALTTDARFAIGPSKSPSGDLVLLMLDDASLAKQPEALAQRADAFGRDLQRVLAAGARRVAVDFLLPASWSESEAFTRLVLQHPDRLTLAAYSSAADEVVGPECLTGTITMALGAERAAALFGFINLDQDDDGVSRKARLFFPDVSGARRPSFAAHVAQLPGSETSRPGDQETGRFWIDHRIDPARFTRVSWKDLDAVLREQPGVFRDRIVLAGADYAGAGDDVRVPLHDRVAGVVLHAMTVETVFAGFPVLAVGRVAFWALSGVACWLLCAASLLVSRKRAVIALAGAAVVWTLAAFAFFASSSLMVPLAVPFLLGLLSWTAGFMLRPRFPAYPAA